MAHILIEENFRHIDGLDMEALIAAFRDQGISAEPTQRQTIRKGTRWVLVLHWLGNQTVLSAVESAAVAVADKVRELYRIKRNGVGEDQRRTPPIRIDLYGPDDALITSVDIPQAEEISDRRPG
ncbi:MAG: hypothetical protein JO362_11320 [Streptomycetaceae bacterium]|nr:hypothetical protein [Streptomycetaceae bacterium]